MTELDAELEDLFAGDTELLDTARRLKAARPQAALDPRFSAVLRAQVMTEAEALLVPRRQRVLLGSRFVAWATGGIGMVAVAAAVAILALNQVHSTTNFVAISSPLAGNSHVDPNQAITVSFNQPMNEESVVASLHIQPATAFRTSWNGNTLTIIPDHHLVADTPYTVTINHDTTKSSNGATLPADVTLSFGTAPVSTPSPTPNPASVPSLSPIQVGATDGNLIGFAPNGSIIANGSPSNLATPTVSATSSPLGTPSPSSSPSASAPHDGLYLYPSAGGSLYLAPKAEAAAVSPDGQHVAFALDNGDGTAAVETVRIDGTHTTILASANSGIVAIAWTSNSKFLFATTQTVSSVDLSKETSTVATASGKLIIALSPAGDKAVLSSIVPGPDVLLNLATSQTRTLQGSGGQVAFSADGKWIAWVSVTHAKPQLVISPAEGDGSNVVPLQGTLSRSSPIALNFDGSLVAYLGSQVPQSLTVADTLTGDAVATGDAQVSELTFDQNDSHLAYVTSGIGPTLNVAPVPESSTRTPAQSDVPEAARTVLDAFLAAQLQRDGKTAASLAPGTGNLIPPGTFNHSYTLDATVNDDLSVTAHAVLVTDPGDRRLAATQTAETLTLVSNGTSYAVSKVDAAAAQSQPPGPHVIGLTSSRSGTLLVISFDSDLNGASVEQAVTLTGTDGKVIATSIHYSAPQRTATVAVLGPSPAHATLAVAASLTDIENQHLAAAYTYTIRG